MTTSPRLARALGIALVALFFLSTGCSDEAGTTTSTSSEESSTSAAVGTTTIPDPGSSSTSSAPESTTPTTTSEPPATTTTDAAGEADMALTQIVFGSIRYIKITNVGQGPGSLKGMWLCQRPGYFELPDAVLAPGEAAAIVVGGGELPDLIGVTQVIDAGGALGVLDQTAGDVGLFTDASFSDPASIIGYVRWGRSIALGRTDTAVAAGIWQEGGTVEVTEGLLAITATSFPTTGPDDWVADIGV